MWIMAKTVHAAFPTHQLSTAPVHCDDLEEALQNTLAMLADVDHAYEQRRTLLEKRSMSLGQRKRVHEEINKLHQKDREPLVLRLADLHYRKMRVTLFRTVH
jgi:hypothetical protein